MRVTITQRQYDILAGVLDLFYHNAEKIDYDSLPMGLESAEVTKADVGELHRLFWESDLAGTPRIDEILVDWLDKPAAPAPQGWDSVETDHDGSPREFASFSEALAHYKTQFPHEANASTRMRVHDAVDDGEITILDYSK